MHSAGPHRLKGPEVQTGCVRGRLRLNDGDAAVMWCHVMIDDVEHNEAVHL